MGMARNIIGTAVGGAAIFAGTGALTDDTTRNETGEITASGGVGAFKVRVGDCIQMPDDAASTVVSVEGVPCSTPHDAQAFAEFTLADRPAFPSDDEMTSLAGRGCLGYWAGAVGSAYGSDRTLEMTFFHPTELSWAQADRVVTCFVISANGSLLTGTKLIS